MNAWDTAVEAIRKCLEQGIREYVVCAGVRNAVLIEVLAQAESAGHVTVRHHFEERGAGFFALGRTMANGAPCAVVTTSGTAVAELLPAMIEAHYQGRALVALTADRPASFRGSGAPQAIVQPGIFGEYAGSGNFVGWDRRSPWHLNVELDEAFEPGKKPEFAAAPVMPQAEVWPRLAVAGLACWLKTDIFRALVLIIGGLEEEDREEVFHFALALGVPVVAEATSGLREALTELALPNPDQLLKCRPPGKVLRIGAMPSGRFWRDLEDLPNVDVWNVTRSRFPGLARESQITSGAVGRVLRALGDVEPIGDPLDYLPSCSRRAAAIDELLEAYPDSEPGLLRALSHYVSLGSGVFLGNSLPIREWNLFAQRERLVPEVKANRGANGIDGQISTWLGVSAARENAWCVLGDLTAFYDLAAPALLEQVTKKGRVLVVINNGGGAIFTRIPRLVAMSERAQELMKNSHQISFEGWAAMWQMRYLRIATVDDFDALDTSGGPLLVELRPSESETREFWQKWDG